MFLKPFTEFLYDHYKKKKFINNVKIHIKVHLFYKYTVDA